MFLYLPNNAYTILLILVGPMHVNAVPVPYYKTET